MKLEGRTFKGNNILNVQVVEHENPNARYSKELEENLVLLCKEMDVPIPMWLSKNTHEFAALRQTIFFAEQFNQKVGFDRFQIRLLE
ncbi:MAG: hypothetical protein MJ166_04770 [Clostridia bacterium]|nr:hypothetical protein [Clostridia bacterium]